MEDSLDDLDFDLDEMLGVEKKEPSAESREKDRLDPRRKQVVCKHWLRDLCKRGDDCDFLHVYDVTRMPECLFYQHYGECPNKECIFLHTRPDDKVEECPWYMRGFCKHGPRCRKRHTRKTACSKYLRGFCPAGSECEFAHPKFALPLPPTNSNGDGRNADFGRIRRSAALAPMSSAKGGQGQAHSFGYRDLQTVTCYRCWQTGHYANRCPNSRLGSVPNQ